MLYLVENYLLGLGISREVIRGDQLFNKKLIKQSFIVWKRLFNHYFCRCCTQLEFLIINGLKNLHLEIINNISEKIIHFFMKIYLKYGKTSIAMLEGSLR